MKRLIAWWRLRQLRLAQENYAKWKGRHDELQRQLSGPSAFLYNPELKQEQAVKAAGEASRYLERVEHLMRL